jgi:alginate O-acetyltransferase complex protein AlgI
MLFNSIQFVFVFLPISLILYHYIRGFNYEYSKIFLTLCSLFFYGYWNKNYLILISISVLFNYITAIGIRRFISIEKYRISNYLLIAGVAVNLGLIGYFKYSNFFIDSINVVFGSSFILETIVLPLAISFFTFQQITFLVDTRRGEIRDIPFIDYALFVVFFPQLIAGPIVHIKEIVPQFASNATKRKYATDIAVGLAIFSVGLFKKVVIADTAEHYVIGPFAASAAGVELIAPEAWGTAFAFGIQIYFDFSGYSDMAIGLARMFGIRLPQNFNSPYKSKNIIEFWRRWHMTLSRFLRDYLYISLGGNRKGRVRRHLNLLMTMLLGGLWHGAGWNFVIWGGLHGIFLVINHAWLTLIPRRFLERWGLNIAYMVSAQVVTLVAVTTAWVFFRAETLASGVSIVASMFPICGSTGSEIAPSSLIIVDFAQLLRGTTYWEGTTQLIFIVGSGLICLGLPNTQELFARFRPVIDARFPVARPITRVWQRRPKKPWPGILVSLFQWRLNFASLITFTIIATFGMIYLFTGTSDEFIYFQF